MKITIPQNEKSPSHKLAEISSSIDWLIKITEQSDIQIQNILKSENYEVSSFILGFVRVCKERDCVNFLRQQGEYYIEQELKNERLSPVLENTMHVLTLLLSDFNSDLLLYSENDSDWLKTKVQIESIEASISEIKQLTKPE